MKIRGGLVAIAVVIALAGGARTAAAQIVNVQNTLGQEWPEGFSGAVDAVGDWRTGNSKKLNLAGVSTLRFRHADHRVALLLRGAYERVGVTDSTVVVFNSFEHLRYRYEVNEWLTGEAFGQHEYDRFRRLSLRALVGVGPRFTLLSRPEAGLVVGVAYMFERVELSERDMLADSGEVENNHRLSSYLIFTTALNDTVTFAETVYAQPLIVDPGDVRVLNESQLQVKLSEHVLFKVSFVLAYDSDPPETVEGLDTMLQTGISLRF